MAINFPNSPSVNDTFTVGGINFTFTGVKWESGAVVEISSDTTPTLGGDLDGNAKNINNVGVITATGFSGPLTGNVTGNADTATTATVATDAEGLTGNPSIQVTNATVLGNLDVQGTTSTIDTAITQVDSLAVEGSVGIGTTNPAAKTHILGASGGGGKLFVDTAGTFGASDTATLGFAVYQGATRSNSQAEIVCVGDGNYSGSLSFKTQNAGTYPNALVERLRITSGGSVAIGTATGETNFLTTINGDLSLGEKNGADNTFIDQKQNGSLEIINSGRVSNDGSVRINRYNNISGDTTYFRDFIVYDGKGTALLTVDGSAGTVSDSMGPLRTLGVVTKSVDYTPVHTDSGKMIMRTGGNVTISYDGAFNQGDMITILNTSSTSMSIIQGSGNTLYNTADGTTGNRTLESRGSATVVYASSAFYISGAGLS